MRAGTGSAIVINGARSHRLSLAVSGVELRPRSHAVVGAVEAEAGDALVAADARRLLEAGGQVVRDLAEDGDLALDDLLAAAGRHVAGDGRDEAVARALVPDALPQRARRDEVLGANLRQEGDGVADEVAVRLVDVDGARAELDGLDRREVGRAAALVVEGHAAVALEVGHAVGHARRVDGQLVVVGAEAVAVRVRVREETGLQDRVGRGLDARHQVRRAEGALLDLGEVVFGVLVEEELAVLAQRVLSLRPHVRQVEDVDPLLLPRVLGLLGRHGLHVAVPAGVVAILNSVVQILL